MAWVEVDGKREESRVINGVGQFCVSYRRD